MNIEMKIVNKQFYTDLDSVFAYATDGSAAFDLVSPVDVTIKPGETKKINTGISIHIGSNAGKDRYAGIILPRSGLGSKGLVLANSSGLIDEDYQGEIVVNVYNNSEISQGFSIGLEAGHKFAQLVIVPVVRVTFKVVDDFSVITTRAAGSYGHTGA